MAVTDEVVTVKQEDYLDQDPQLRGQKYACLSFISPNDVLKSKETFVLHKFLKPLGDDINILFTNLSDRFKDDHIVVDMIKNLRERHAYLDNETTLQDELNFFKEANSSSLENEFLEANNFRTTMQGIKIRGVYETLKEAKHRAEMIKRFDNKFDVYICEVGCWCPWNPYGNDVDQEYAETQLNTLMKKYKENLNLKDEFFRQRMEEKVKDAKDFDAKVNQASAGTIVYSDENGVIEGDANKDLPELLKEDPWMANRNVEASSSATPTEADEE